MKKSNHLIRLGMLAGALPLFYGCGSSGISSLTSFLFGTTGIGGGIALLGGAAADVALSSGTELATLHQPEPASLLLLGGGLAAVTYLKSKTNRHNK